MTNPIVRCSYISEPPLTSASCRAVCITPAIHPQQNPHTFFAVTRRRLYRQADVARILGVNDERVRQRRPDRVPRAGRSVGQGRSVGGV